MNKQLENLKELLREYEDKVLDDEPYNDSMASEIRHQGKCWQKMKEDGVIPAELDNHDMMWAVFRADGFGGTVQEWLDGSAFEAAGSAIRPY